MTTFGEKLLRLLEERNRSLRALARQVPCNPGYLSRVSRGLKYPSEDFAARLDDILGAGGELVAARVPDRDGDEHERLLYVARNPARLDVVVVDGLAATLASHRRVEDLVGSAAVLDTATSNLELALRLLREARGPHTKRLSAVASEASQFTGWLHKAVGSHGKAGILYDQALRLGVQAADDDLAATALSMRGHLAWAEGDVSGMATLSEAAASLATAVGTRAVATQQQGRALALAGDRAAALRAIGKAEDILGAATGVGDPDGLYFYNQEYLAMQRGLIQAYLAESPADHARAAEQIGGSIPRFPESIRNSGWMAWWRVQAARARVSAGEVDEAASGLVMALKVVEVTATTETRKEILSVWRLLMRRWPSQASVMELGEALRH